MMQFKPKKPHRYSVFEYVNVSSVSSPPVTTAFLFGVQISVAPLSLSHSFSVPPWFAIGLFMILTSTKAKRLLSTPRYLSENGCWIYRVFDDKASRRASSGGANILVHRHSLPLFGYWPLAWRESMGQWIHHLHFSRKLLPILGITVFNPHHFFFFASSKERGSFRIRKTKNL